MDYSINSKTLILNAFIKLAELVTAFESEIIKRFKINGSYVEFVGTKISRKGILKSGEGIYKYEFHGASCLLKFKDLEVDIIITPYTKEKVKITPGNFMRFIQSYHKDSILKQLEFKDFYSIFLDFEKQGIINRDETMGLCYEIPKELP